MTVNEEFERMQREYGEFLQKYNIHSPEDFLEFLKAEKNMTQEDYTRLSQTLAVWRDEQAAELEAESAVPTAPKPYAGTHAKMLPIPILFYALLNLRKRLIKDYIHEKLHPWL